MYLKIIDKALITQQSYYRFKQAFA